MDLKRVVSFVACGTIIMTSCGNSDKEKNIGCKAILKIVESEIDDEFIGIIGSSAKYNYGNDALEYRNDIKDDVSGNNEWLIFSENDEIQVYTSNDWDSDKVKGYPENNSDGKTLAELFDEKKAEMKKSNESLVENNSDSDDMLGYVEKSKRTSANSSAKLLLMSLSTVLVDLEAEGKNISTISYVTIYNGKFIAYDGTGSKADISDEMLELMYDYFSDYSEITYCLMFVENGTVVSSYIADEIDDNIIGAYPNNDDSIYEKSMNDLADENLKYYLDVAKANADKINNSKTSTAKSGGDTFSVYLTGSTQFGEDMIVDWMENEGIDVELNIIMQNTSLYEANEIVDDLSAIYLSGEDLDFAMLDNHMMQIASEKNIMMPLVDIGISEADYSDCYDFSLDCGKNINDEQCALSFEISPMCYAYRTDLAEQFFGIRTPEEMQSKISDWDKFLTASEELSSASNGSVFMIDSVGGMCNAFYTGRDSMFMSSGEVTFGDETSSFVNLVDNMWQNSYVNKDAQWSMEWYDLLDSNNVMGVYTASWGIDQTILRDINKSAGKWNICMGPEAAYWGGTLAGAVMTTDNPEYCESLLRYYTSNIDGITNYALNVSETDFLSSNRTANNLLAADDRYNSDYLGGQNKAIVYNEIAENIPSQSRSSQETNAEASFYTELVEELGEGNVSTESIESEMKSFLQ